IPGKVPAGLTVITHDHPDVADGHHDLGHHLDGGKPAVDEIGAVRQRDVLPAAAAASPQECIGVLVVVVVIGVVAVVAHGGGDDFPGGKRGPVLDGDNTDPVHRNFFLGIDRVYSLDRGAHHYRMVASDFAQLVMPGHERFQLLTALQV